MRAVIILIQSRDQKGLVARISSFFFERAFSILDCQQHVDLETGEFFMRLKLDLENRPAPPPGLDAEFRTVAVPLGLTWSWHYTGAREPVAILVSRAAHCLYDLLVREREGELPCRVALVIGNHPDLASVAGQFTIPFHHLPVAEASKDDQEVHVRGLLREHKVGLIVLARYMQILSPAFVDEYPGRIINIHHAFLPAFQGARPYHQAYERGVKMIGATAHYVTADLDEGPIIEQGVERVTHEDTPHELGRIGRDIERVVLARAVKAHLEHRVIISGRKTIVFSSGV
jgi:formyltetrahydrofolate deformylase